METLTLTSPMNLASRDTDSIKPLAKGLETKELVYGEEPEQLRSHTVTFNQLHFYK